MRRNRGFTLIELLVVVGIIIMATAMALPAINGFLKGQKLTQAGRLVQSAFNEARRSAITQRANHFIFVGRIAGSGVQPDLYALAHYREGKGWDSVQLTKLPSSISIVFDGANEDDFLMPIKGCNLKVQDWTNGLPAANATSAFANPEGSKTLTFAGSDFTIAKTCAVYQFRKDGTIAPLYGAVDVPAATNPLDIYDVNTTVQQVDKALACDLILKQVGEPSKRCFFDVDVNTGRVRFRVCDTESQDGSGSTGTK